MSICTNGEWLRFWSASSFDHFVLKNDHIFACFLFSFSSFLRPQLRVSIPQLRSGDRPGAMQFFQTCYPDSEGSSPFLVGPIPHLYLSSDHQNSGLIFSLPFNTCHFFLHGQKKVALRIFRFNSSMMTSIRIPKSSAAWSAADRPSSCSRTLSNTTFIHLLSCSRWSVMTLCNSLTWSGCSVELIFSTNW